MEKPQKMPKVAKVKNKAPAEIQITAEQLLREAKERDLEILPPPPKQKISDPHELADYQHRKRKVFEDNIRKNRIVISNWIKYAQWEESQNEIRRARSIYERALDVDHRNVTLWLKYTEMEMRHRQVNYARNLWDRAVSILPRVNQFWYKYTYMEEMLENIAGARQVFERWMEWEPDEQAWQTYIKFELRYKEIQRARDIFERFVMVHPDVKHWIKYARFEENHGFLNGSRKVYERAFVFFGDESLDDKLVIAFARFEEGQREHDRVRVIYKYALDNLPKDKTQEIYKAYTIHEKKYGDRSGIEDVIVSKRKHQYEQEVKENPSNYDAWFDYLRLVESEGEVEIVRETYERAIANVPPTTDKQFWRRYIYLWINYALYEELETEDIERCRQVYSACLNLIPHKKFTFSKIWLMYAQFEIRQKNLTGARKFLGMALGICPRNKLYRGYIDLEIQLREFDRCRILYQKFLEFGPENCTTWMKFAELETLLGDIERARGIYELAISQPVLEMPDVLWKAYIDFERGQDEPEKARQLYERLLEKTLHVKVWISYGKFELTNPVSEEGLNNVVLARRIFERGNNCLRDNGNKESRALLLEAWRDFENNYGDEESQSKILEKMPRRVKRRRRVIGEDKSDDGWEEVFDFIFPEDESQRPHLKVLASAKAWKQKAMLLSNHSNSESLETNENTDDTESSNSPIVEPSNERADLKFLAAAKAWKKKDESNEKNSDTADSEVENQTTESADNETN
ncbi:protein crooked neck [Leptopilina heterotoma]|uniref:protein crooked neck n=1 Tax=Leptopilina heterotoma TaxID=63436 RepID=UPI001CA90161|nr:protein crooked neck [Leptopilina heterotoma]XP_043472971.1 protein crooked neck [Leptopilina heterotoma]